MGECGFGGVVNSGSLRLKMGVFSLDKYATICLYWDIVLWL